MTDINTGEYGQVLYANLGEDISTATSLAMVLVPKTGKIEEISDGVTVGTANVDVGDNTYLANEYIQYTTKQGDIDKSGQWRIRGEAILDPLKNVIGDFTDMTVLA